MKRISQAALVVLFAVWTLTGCSSEPARDDVLERFDIELEHDVPASGERESLASSMTDAALAGQCGDDSSQYWSSPIGKYGWAAVCLTEFEDDMTAEQQKTAQDLVLEATLNRRD